MMNARVLTICAFGIALLAQRIDAQDFSRYRTFELESSLASVSSLTGGAVSDAQTLHERPALLQELKSTPSYWNSASGLESTDPVEQMVFSFYNNQLFRIVVDYRRDRTEGLTDADLVESLSAAYGPPLARLLRSPAVGGLETDSDTLVARWGDAEHSIALYRTPSYRQTFRLIVAALPLDGLARKAEAQAKRLDDQEAPRRELARRKKELADGRAAAEKARVANKKVFEP